jgi:hypothetical protein
MHGAAMAYRVITPAVRELPSSVGGTYRCANQVVTGEPLALE